MTPWPKVALTSERSSVPGLIASIPTFQRSSVPTFQASWSELTIQDFSVPAFQHSSVPAFQPSTIDIHDTRWRRQIYKLKTRIGRKWKQCWIFRVNPAMMNYQNRMKLWSARSFLMKAPAQNINSVTLLNLDLTATRTAHYFQKYLT